MEAAGPSIGALRGCQVQQLLLDYQATLLLVGDAVRAHLVIEADFVHSPRASEELHVQPGVGETMTSLPELFNRVVSAVSLSEDETLTLRFDDDSWLRVVPDRRYESWHLMGEGVPQILVGPD